LPDFHLQVPGLGNTWLVGSVFQFHLMVVATIMGIGLIAPALEMIGLRRGGGYWERLAHHLSLIIAVFFAFGATWAVFGLVALYGLYPRLFGVLTSAFSPSLWFVGGIWVIMTATAYLYYHTWKRLANKRGLHQAIGWLFAASAFTFISLITELSSFMLTPTNTTDFAQAALNPSWPTEIIHRHIGNLSYAGLVLAGYAGLRVLFGRRDAENQAFFDWVGNFGLFLGLGVALLQPFAGWFYAYQVGVGSPAAFGNMMVGVNSWMFLVQQFFLGSVLIFGNLYLSSGMKRAKQQGSAAVWMRYSVIALAALTILAIIPKEYPFGQMYPWKYISLAGFIVLTLANLVLYIRAGRDFEWGKVGRGSQAALLMVTVTIMALMITMGTIRESARGGDLIFHKMGPGQSQDFRGP
jgi:cytochrome bd ubiquinol oxidase subunit I